MNLKTALTEAGFTGQLLAAWMPWTGDPARISHSTRYIQTTPSVIAAQIACMKASGFDGIVTLWQGPTNAFTDQAFFAMSIAAIEAGMTVVPMLDPWIAKNQANPTQATISALESAPFQSLMEFIPSKYVMEFSLASSAGVNIASVQAALAALKILSWHTGYAWPSVGGADPATLKADNAKPTCIFPCVYYGFNDGGYPETGGVSDLAAYKGVRDWNTSVWGGQPSRIIDPGAGGTFLDAAATIPTAAKYAMFATWNDWDEGTDIEGFCSMATGIRIA